MSFLMFWLTPFIQRICTYMYVSRPMVYGCSVTVQRDSHSRNLKILEKNILEKKNLKIPEEDEEEPGGRGGVTRRDSEWRMLPPRRGGDPTQRKTDWSSHIPPLTNTNTSTNTNTA